MLISGSIKEVRAIMHRSIAIDAKAIQFMFPNHAIAVSDKGEYAYFRTSLFLSHSAILPRNAINNLERFFKFAWNQRSQRPKSPFHALAFSDIAIHDNRVEFDRNPDFSFEVETGFVPVDHASAMVEKFEMLGQTSVMPRRPYLKLRPEVIDDVYDNSKRYAIDYAEKHGHTYVNTCIAENHQLHVRRDPKMEMGRFLKDPYLEHHVFDEGFVIFKDYEGIPFKISDLDIVSFHRLIRETVVDSVVLIPFDNFYIAEAHGSDLLCKFHTKIKS